MKVLILDYLNECVLEQNILGSGHTVVCLSCKHENELPIEIETADAIIVYHHVHLSETTLKRMKACKVIVRGGVGFDNVDYRAAGKLGIPVVNVPDYGTNDVADHAIALLLSLVRKIPVYHDALRNNPLGNWKPEIGGDIRRITGTKIGIVGLGRIGTAFAHRAKAFGMHVSFYDPYVPDGTDKAHHLHQHHSLESLVESCDYISIHAPLTSETRDMFNEQLFSKLKLGATLINVSRGEIVSPTAVFASLQDNTLSAFGADVFQPEPPNPDDALLLAYHKREAWIEGRMILTPHMAFYAEESRNELRSKSAMRANEVLSGKRARNCINGEYLVNSRTPVAALNNQ